MRIRFKTRTLLVIVLLVAVLITVLSSISRTQVLLNNERWIGHYTGFGLTDSNDITGFRYYSFHIDDLPYRTWVVSFQGKEFNDVQASYPDGSKALIGTCRVEGAGRQMYPLIDELGTATSYRPDGSVAAVVENGTGTALLLFPNGQVQWKMEYENYERVAWSLWNEDGTLDSTSQTGGQ